MVKIIVIIGLIQVFQLEIQITFFPLPADFLLLEPTQQIYIIYWTREKYANSADFGSRISAQ